VENNTSAILSGSTFPPTSAMLEMIVNLLVPHFRRLIAMFTLPYPLVQRFYTHWTFSGFVSLNTDDPSVYQVQ